MLTNSLVMYWLCSGNHRMQHIIGVYTQHYVEKKNCSQLDEILRHFFMHKAKRDFIQLLTYEQFLQSIVQSIYLLVREAD